MLGGGIVMKKFSLLLGTVVFSQMAVGQDLEENVPPTTESQVSEAVEQKTESSESKTATTDDAALDAEKGNTPETSETEPNQVDKTEHAPLSYIIPESAGLPQSVFRFRAIYGSASSETSYDGAGKEDESTKGFALNASGLAFALEYGVSDRLSAQFLVPWSLGGEVKLADENAFRTRADIRAQVESAVDLRLAPLLSNLKANFGAGWDANIATPSDVLDPSTGAVLIPAGTPVQDGFNAVRQAGLSTGFDQAVATARSWGERQRTEGLGDVEIGARYSLSTMAAPWIPGVPLYTSVAAGLRLNTSGYAQSTEKGELPAGRGTTDLGLRVNVDYEPVLGIQLQTENQSEFMVASGKAYTNKKELGGEEKELKRDGFRHVGYTKLVMAPGAWFDPVEILILNARFNWDNDPETELGGAAAEGLHVKRSMQYGLTLDGLKYQVPMQLDYDYVMALASPSTRFATDAHQVQLKLFYKF